MRERRLLIDAEDKSVRCETIRETNFEAHFQNRSEHIRRTSFSEIDYLQATRHARCRLRHFSIINHLHTVRHRQQTFSL
jgi:hypothetical protein